MNERQCIINRELDNENRLLRVKCKFLKYECDIHLYIHKFIRDKRRDPKSLKEIWRMKRFPEKLKNNPLTGNPLTKKREKKLFKILMGKV